MLAPLTPKPTDSKELIFLMVFSRTLVSYIPTLAERRGVGERERGREGERERGRVSIAAHSGTQRHTAALHTTTQEHTQRHIQDVSPPPPTSHLNAERLGPARSL
jgi:hypothetical protein